MNSNQGTKEGFLEGVALEMGLKKSGILTHGMSLGAEIEHDPGMMEWGCIRMGNPEQ